MLQQMDPVGVADRRQHRLRRRTYSSRGPNDVWHADGYDKLRPYGILISGYVLLFIVLYMPVNVYVTKADTVHAARIDVHHLFIRQFVSWFIMQRETLKQH